MKRTTTGNTDILKLVVALVDYACDHGLIGAEDRSYAANLLLDVLGLEALGSFYARERTCASGEVSRLEEILATLLADAVARGVIDGGIASRDLLDTRLMGCVTPRPSEVVREFWRRYEDSPKEATAGYVDLMSQFFGRENVHPTNIRETGAVCLSA